MNVSLTPHFEEFVQTLVGTGKYHSASEVVRDALRLLQEKEDALLRKREALKALISEGLESGDPKALDINSILAEAKERYGSGPKKKG